MPKNNNRSNLSIVCFHNHYSYNYDFNYNDFVPGENNKTNWNLDVKDKSKDAKAVITFGDRAGHDTTVVISYFIRKPAFRNKSLDLGLIRFGHDTLGDIWLLNQSATAPLILNNIFLKYNDRGFELLDANMDVLSFPLILSPLDSVKLMVRFTGVQKGVYSDSIGISDDCTTWMLGYVQAETGKPEISVSDFSFPDTYLQSKVSGQVVIRNQGNYNLIITNYIPPADKAFNIDIQDISVSKPLILVPGQFFTCEATFEPTQEKDYIDSAVFESDASETDSTLILTGKGIIKTGVNENDDKIGYLSIYPNPADGKLVVKFDKLISAYNIKLFDIYGNLVEEKAIEYGRTSLILDVSGLSNGVYFLLLNSVNYTMKSSFIIIR